MVGEERVEHLDALQLLAALEVAPRRTSTLPEAYSRCCGGSPSRTADFLRREKLTACSSSRESSSIVVSKRSTIDAGSASPSG